MKWKPLQGSLRPVNPFGSKFRLLMGLFVVLFSIFLLPMQTLSALEELKDGTDLSKLNIHKFDLNVNNVSVLSKSEAIEQVHLTNPNYEYLGAVYPGEMENFTIKVDKSQKADQVFNKPLSLKFSNVGTAYGKQVDAYLTFNKVTLHYLNSSTAEAQMNDAQKNAVEFFSISELWERSAFEIGNIPYVDAAHNNIMNKAFWVEADVTAELRYADGSDTDLKLVMKPTDIDVVDGFGLKESFYINDYKNAVDKRLMNNANALNQTDQSGRTIWEATTSTSGAANENNISGLAVRSADNTLNFGYLSTEACSAVFGLYIEKVDPKPVLEVDPVKIPAKEGQEVTYKGTFKIPVPGKDILATPTTIEMTETFDERLDYKELKVEAGGNAWQEGRDYTIEKKGQTVTVKMTPEYVKANSSQDIVITYKTATNQKVAEKGAATIENTVTLKVDNLSAPSNQVTTDLLYEKKHEFVSGTAGKELPQEIKDLTPETEKNLENGTKTTPTQPMKTEVQAADGTWTFKSYDKNEETINGADAHFVGTWDFTPAPTYKATHEFVSGTAGKELPQEVKALLPSDKPDLADGTKTTPTQPTKTEVQTADGTWTFKSYDKNEETINGSDVKFVGTWDFTPAPTYKATHEFVSGTAGKELPQAVKSMLPADKPDLADGTKTTPTQPSKTEVKTTEGTWTFKSYDKTEEIINGADVKFVGTWDFTPAPTYKATHEFVSGTAGKELPQEVKSLLPSDKPDLADGTKATPTQPMKTEVKTADGTWTFKSYDKAEETINGADAHFVGTWDFTPAPTYKVTHEFVSGTAGKELPQAVKDLLPSDKSDLADGTKATPTQPVKTEVKTADGTWTFKSYDKAEETINGADAHFVGTWTFKSYDKAEETINGADAHFVGTWNFTPVPTYKATHEFISGTAGKELPQEVKALLPADKPDLADGTKTTPTQPVKTEVKTADGTWTFKSYDKTEETINGADAHFVGTWEFTATPSSTYKAVHEFVSGTASKELPQEVKALLPADKPDLADGTKTTPTQPVKTEVETSDGTWSFQSYDKNEATINGADAKFVGTWTFVAKPSPAPTYKATHEFVSGTAGKELPQEVKALLPSDKSDLADGTKATPTQPSKTEVKTTEGTWTFKSYDKAEETINGADARFVGTWDFTPAPTYKATHEFVSGTAGKELPQAVKDILPSDKPNLADGTKATPTQPVKTEVETSDGAWSFQSYNKNETTINGADVHFVGTWTFAADSTTLTGSVIWIDNDNAAGRRPQSVLVHLLADGQDTGISVTVDEAMGWKYSFENLPRFKDGKEIIYSVREDEVEGYSNQAEGMNVTNRLLVDAKVKEIGKKRILPKTGQDTSIWMLILGFLTFGGAVGLTKRQRD